MKDFASRDPRRRSARRGRGSHDSFLSDNVNRRDHKTAQLCRQVFRALSLALGECGDDLLRELVVVEVRPAPDAGRLLVTVTPSAAGDPLDLLDLLGRLDRAGGRLRHAVAEAITRKRAPELAFTFAPAGPEGVTP